jgi:hypothetical protein
MSHAAAQPLLAELDGILATFAPDAARRKRALLEALRTRAIRTAREALELHRAVCFLRAFPDDRAVYRAACALATGFGARVARLPRAERAQLDDSGLAGSVVRHVYTTPRRAGWRAASPTTWKLTGAPTRRRTASTRS